MAAFICLLCGHSQTVDDKHVGKIAACPKCKTQSIVRNGPAANDPDAGVCTDNGVRVRKQIKGGLGLEYRPSPEMSIQNKNSTIRREWIVIDSDALPVEFASVCGVSAVVSQEAIENGRGVEFEYATTVILKTKDVALSAVEIRFLVFDVWGSHIRTLSLESIADIPPFSGHTNEGAWHLFSINEGEHYFASLGYIARVRTKDGKVIHADTEIVLREAQRFSDNFTEEDLEPRPPKRE